MKQKPSCTKYCPQCQIDEDDGDVLENCLLCKKLYTEIKPTSFTYSSKNKRYEWVCDSCSDQPRGFFLEEMIGMESEDKIEPCCLCGKSAELIAFTKDNDDGEFLCQECSSSPKGKVIIKEHWAIIEDMNTSDNA